MRRWIEIGTPAVAVAAVLVVWTWIVFAAAFGGECRRYKRSVGAATSLAGVLVNLVALADSTRRARARRGLWVSLGAAGALVLRLVTALVQVLAACGS